MTKATKTLREYRKISAFERAPKIWLEDASMIARIPGFWNPTGEVLEIETTLAALEERDDG